MKLAGDFGTTAIATRLKDNSPTISELGSELGAFAMITLDENASLISAGKVTGTNVYNTAGDSLGEIYDVMIDKRSGRTAYAVMSFGGFLGIGEQYHPLPWATLKYDTNQGGYVVGLTREQLEGAPTFAAGDQPFRDRAAEQQIHDYYRAHPYWA